MDPRCSECTERVQFWGNLYLLRRYDWIHKVRSSSDFFLDHICCPNGHRPLMNTWADAVLAVAILDLPTSRAWQRQPKAWRPKSNSANQKRIICQYVQYPIPSIYGIFTYIYLYMDCWFLWCVDKYTIHGWYEYWAFDFCLPKLNLVGTDWILTVGPLRLSNNEN